MTFRLVDANWDSELLDACKADGNAIRIVCPFIQRRPIERLLKHAKTGTVQVITRFNLADFSAGVSDLHALQSLLDYGAEVRGVRNLHAKIYLFGKSRAIVTSANLTNAGLRHNHEFGFVSEQRAVADNCNAYFNKLWSSAGANLTQVTLDAWIASVTEFLVTGAQLSHTSAVLQDFGQDVGILPDLAPAVGPNTGWPSMAEQSFVKLFGQSHKRKVRSKPVLVELDRSGCHWACTYPKNRRPRMVEDGACMYMGLMMKDPSDIVVFGRGFAMKYKEGRDDATPEDIAKRPWKAEWPHYIRVHDVNFVAGVTGNGVSLNALMKDLGADTFMATQRNAAKGIGNTNPRTAYRQQPAVELSLQGQAMLKQRLEAAF